MSPTVISIDYLTCNDDVAINLVFLNPQRHTEGQELLQP